MSALTALFIGGTGTISAACASRAIDEGISLTVLNRGISSLRPLPAGAQVVTGDIEDPSTLRSLLSSQTFDVVVDFISYTPEHARRDVKAFAGNVGHYVYISSAAVYEKPPSRLPITESTPLHNPFWQYARDKIASELVLQDAFRESGFPVTIVRPSHTYDQTRIPVAGGWTVIDRIRRGEPVVVHGDGTSLWTLTHSRDFAVGLVGLLGNPQTIGDTVHITSDEVLTWNQITTMMGRAAGRTPEIVHVTSRELVAQLPQLEGMHLGDRTHSHIFDNTKIRSLVPAFTITTPFSVGVREIIEWHDADESRRVIDPSINSAIDALLAATR